MEKNEIIICDCYSTEHQMVVFYDSDENDEGVKHPMCYIHVHLVKKPFLKRLVHGIKYIFGYKCRFGAFDEFIINPDDVHRFQNIVDHLNQIKSMEDERKKC
jgi:hypothetical protein